MDPDLTDSVDEDPVVLEARARAQGIAAWVLAGLLLGGLGPGAVIVWMGDGAQFAGFVVGSSLVGIVGGLLIGLLDPPRHVGTSLAVAAPLAALAGLIIGPFWAGLAGAVGGAGFLVPGLVMAPSGSSDLIEVFSMVMGIGAGLGSLVGTLPVVAFSAARAVTLRLQAPWWLAHVAAAALVSAIAVPAFSLTLGGL